MRRSPWLPILLLVAVGLYFAPRSGGQGFDFNFNFQPLPQLQAPQDLPLESQDLFRKTRPASVRVEQSSNAYGGPDAIGTGFFIDDKGTLLTAYHVVDGARFLNVTTVSQQRFRASVVGFDAARDIAVLKADIRGTVPFLNLAPREPRPGEAVLAVGNSRGQFLQPRRGRLLRLNAEAARADFPQGTLEMSAPLAPGDSGGPIVNSAGQAIGVVSYIRLAGDASAVQPDGDVRTLASYAVPVTSADATVRALRAGAKRDVPALGIKFDAAHDGQLGVPGAVVAEVVPGGPADKAGVRGAKFDAQNQLVSLGDIIVAVDGQATSGFDELQFQVRQKRIGETVTLTVKRGGGQVKLPVVLGPKATIFAGSQQ